MGYPMPEVASPKVRVSRQSVRVLWASYAGGLAFCVLVVMLGAATDRAGAAPWSVPAVLCATLAAMAGGVALTLTRGLPQAGHPVFDTVGQRFDFAMRHLFLRFVLAGAAAELCGVLGALVLVLGGSEFVSGVFLAVAFLMLLFLRHRVAPLVHYLA